MVTRNEFWFYIVLVLIIVAGFLAKMVGEGMMSPVAAGAIIMLAAVSVRYAAKRINPPQSDNQEESSESVD